MAVPKGAHPGTYNAPTTREVAVIIQEGMGNFREISLISRDNQIGTVDRIVQDNQHQRQHRDLRLPLQSSSFTNIVETHRSYDGLQYPLANLFGENGYDINLKRVDGKSLSCMDYYSYLFMTRLIPPASGDAIDNVTRIAYNHILNCRELLNQYAVDMYAKVESERLWFIRNNQDKLRAEKYSSFHDAIANNENPHDIGKRVILPATHIGSPRHMHEYAQDAMAYVRCEGRPCLFITFTCNRNWPEIKEQLRHGQSSQDRHDIISRVFRLKQKRFIELLTKDKIFGEVTCWIYTIEWQKRGLPHSHNLIWFKDKIQPNDVDSIISAELPDPVADPVLHETVLRCMIHNPCTTDLQSSCKQNDNKKCSKKYPRKFIPETQHGEDGYPTYRRRSPSDGGFTGTITKRNKTITIDNSWVVPYNALLLRIFDAHINVEYCHSVKCIKYICKYIHKGSDRLIFRLCDEIEGFRDGRYISTNEAFWRIFGFPIHDRFPSVLHLTVHLENEHMITFNPEEVEAGTSAAAQGVAPKSTLLQFFELCKHDQFAKELLYVDVGKHYTWSNGKFKRRVNEKLYQIGRVYTVHPRETERFYLRMLLHKIRGPESFVFLRTVNGVVCETFQQACQELGLLESDNHWDLALGEAADTSHPYQIRDLFAVILTSGVPANPHMLWDTHKWAMSEDFFDNDSLELHSEQGYKRALIAIEDKCIEICGSRLKDLGLQFEFDMTELRSIFSNNSDDNDLPNRLTIEKMKESLNESQKAVYLDIMQNIQSEMGGIIFLDAPGGTGKTYLINLIISEVQLDGGVAIAVASSGNFYILNVPVRIALFKHFLTFSFRHCRNTTTWRKNCSFGIYHTIEC